MKETEPQTFLVGRNLRVESLADDHPWNFAPAPEDLKRMRELIKDERKKHLLKEDCSWNVYSAVEGLNPSVRISTENPASRVRGLVADYDAVMPLEAVLAIVRGMSPEFAPNFVERSLGMKYRLVWIFQKPLLVTGNPHAAAVYKMFSKTFKIPSLLAGFDPGSEKPASLWTNGGEWIEFKKEPLAWSLIFGIAVDAGKTLTAVRADMPLEAVADEVAKRWPGRWNGPFEVGALGVRFWDDNADNATGCQVKPDGMLCFTGNDPFVKWAKIFGTAWVNEKQALNLARIAENIFHDGNTYFQQLGGQWRGKARQDVLLELSARGLDRTKQKGQTMSDADRALHHIQNTNRIDGAAPLIYRPKGIVDVSGLQILNTNSLQPVQPAEGDYGPEDFPFMWKFVNGLFVRVDGQDPLSHWLAWWKRSYVAILEHRPLMGQAVFLCGPISNGKTLWCYRMLAPSLGGRVVNPYDFFTKKTDFTDELFGSALWAINDEESPDERSKLAMQAKLKSCVVNPEQTYHPKFRTKLSLPWQGRIVVTLNNGPTSVGMLPEINDETRDKLMFFATRAFDGVFPEEQILEAQIAAELPKFLSWLLKWKAPEAVTKGALTRMGVQSYFDPGLLFLSQQQAYFFTFCELLAVWAEAAPTFTGPTWTGNPTRLAAEMHLVDSIKDLVREFPVEKIAKALTALARIGGLGVESADGNQGRMFRLTKALLAPNTTTTAKVPIAA
jgi:hypothetical protein